ncbi:MAG: hypothetical protein HY042_00115, partial [Spirochaetia bacterium]|nr:hypothetical protein [Spirochaetia bacterium]
DAGDEERVLGLLGPPSAEGDVRIVAAVLAVGAAGLVAPLKERIDLHVPESDRAELEKEYLTEIQELIGDFNRGAAAFLKKYPGEPSVRKLGIPQALKASDAIRELKHILIEVQESVREMERRMLEKDTSRAARYVTKFKKDINNAVNLLLIKGNERITDAANGKAG